MSNLISRQEVIEWLVGQKYITVDETSDTMSEGFESDHLWELSRNCFINDAIKHIQEQPTIEAEPVVHGRWIHDINNLYGCSECMERENMSHKRLKPYCSNCGSKMDGGSDE